jgi:hypothetical protein
MFELYHVFEAISLFNILFCNLVATLMNLCLFLDQPPCYLLIQLLYSIQSMSFWLFWTFHVPCNLWFSFTQPAHVKPNLQTTVNKPSSSKSRINQSINQLGLFGHVYTFYQTTCLCHIPLRISLRVCVLLAVYPINLLYVSRSQNHQRTYNTMINFGVVMISWAAYFLFCSKIFQ